MAKHEQVKGLPDDLFNFDKQSNQSIATHTVSRDEIYTKCSSSTVPRNETDVFEDSILEDIDSTELNNLFSFVDNSTLLSFDQAPYVAEKLCEMSALSNESPTESKIEKSGNFTGRSTRRKRKCCRLFCHYLFCHYQHRKKLKRKVNKTESLSNLRNFISMMSDDDFKNHECSNMFRCLMALKHLRDSLIVFCEEIVKQHHASLLKKLPEIKDSCEHCTLEKLLPFHLYEKKACPSQSKRKCFCSKKAGRQLCPNDGFCSKFFDLIVLEHRFRDPLWKNTDPRKWKDCPWSVAVCFINTQGYHDKGTADDTDCRGLLSIIINNLKFETELQEITINGVNDIFKKARDLANLVHHSSNYEITDETTQSCMELVKSILQIQSINVADLLQKNESILSSSEGDLADQLPTDTESKEGSVTGTGLICSTDAINAMKEDVEGVQMSPPGAVHQDCCVRSNPDDVTDPQITDVSQHMTGAMKEDVEALPISKPHAVQQACSVRSNPDEVPEPQIMEASQRMSDAMQEDVEAVQISLPGAVHQDCSVRSNPDDVTDPQITDVSQHMTGAMKEDAEALPISQRHAVHQACSVRSNPEEVPEPKIMEASQRMSGGSSIPVPTDQASSLIVSGHEQASHTGYSRDRLNENIELVHQGRQENGRNVAELRNDCTTIFVISTPPRHPDYEVSQEQAGTDRSEFAFSSGLSIPVTTDQASRSSVGGREHASHNGYRLNENIEHVHHGRQENGRHVEELRNDRTNISAISTPPRHPDYVEYSDRLRTYARWTHRRPDPPTLSGAGFFFTNDGDLVRCYQCGIGLKDFCEEDNPLKDHVRHSGNCPYLEKYLGATKLAELKRQLQTEDPEYNRLMQWNARHTLDPTTTNYRHPKYQTLQSRLSSFSSWPQHMVQTPQQLADAGLFYTGFEDQVRCFACDGGLRRWDPDDDPWTEHCRWFPGCPFARQQKGDEYIALIQAAVAYEDQIAKQNGAQSGDQDLSGAMEQMLSRKPEFRAAMNEHMDTCLDMGYQLEDFNEAVSELRNGGSIKPTIVEVIDEIEMLSKRGKYRKKRYMPYEMIAKQNGAQSGDQDLSGAMEQMLSRKPEFRAAMNEHMDTCLDMGYQLEDFNEAVSELRNGGSIKPTIVEVIDEIEMLSKRGKYRKKRYMPYEMENKGLKNLTICMKCSRNNVDALFLPCTHHRTCMECAEPLTQCPVCDKIIRQKIRTYMA